MLPGLQAFTKCSGYFIWHPVTTSDGGPADEPPADSERQSQSQSLHFVKPRAPGGTRTTRAPSGFFPILSTHPSAS
eukprot:759809-Hanusia_phi.AAC.1